MSVALIEYVSIHKFTTGIFDGAHDVTIHAAVELESSAVTGYSKLVLLVSDSTLRLVACVGIILFCIHKHC